MPRRRQVQGRIALIVNWLGKCHVLDLRLDQRYLRSLPVRGRTLAVCGILADKDAPAIAAEVGYEQRDDLELSTNVG